MPSILTYPGVCIEEVSSGLRSIAGVATSITAFAGWTARGDTDRAALAQSWAGFERSFVGRVPAAKDAAPMEIPLDQGAWLTDKQIASLAAYTAAVAKSAKQNVADTTTVLKLAKEFVPELAPGVKTLLDKISEQAERRAESAVKFEKSMRKAFERMAEDIQHLQDRGQS